MKLRLNQKGLTPVVILLLIILGIGGYFIYTNYSNNQQLDYSIDEETSQQLQEEQVEFERKNRDVVRLTDFSNIQLAINGNDFDPGVTKTSGLKGLALYCSGATGQTTFCAGSSTTDNTNWVKMDLKSQKVVTTTSLQTKDPINDVSYHYVYCGDNSGWEINTVLESKYYMDKMKDDGGDDPNKYELGSNLQLINKYPQCKF